MQIVLRRNIPRFLRHAGWGQEPPLALQETIEMAFRTPVRLAAR
jgi:hypothetical protein